jgi:putative addiction module killer protein
MLRIVVTKVFDRWLQKLRDPQARTRIFERVRRLRDGNPGDSKSVGGGALEMRIDYGPGYRIYYTRHGDALVILLCGGDKSSQRDDIARAVELARRSLT